MSGDTRETTSPDSPFVSAVAACVGASGADAVVAFLRSLHADRVTGLYYLDDLARLVEVLGRGK
jgi:hypothetical protein